MQMNKALWLCSWYPHPGDPYEGDFIQRHAKAVSVFIPTTVFYTSQAGTGINVNKDWHIEQQTDAVTENIIFFRYKKTGIKPVDKFIYNLKYFQSYKKAITEYVNGEGKPDIVHVHIPLKAGMIGRWINRKWGIPYIVSEHSAHYTTLSEDNFFAKSFFHRYNVKRVIKDAIAVTNVSEAGGKILKSLFGLTNARVIHNTVDTKLFYFGNRAVSKFRFIHVSTLADHQKNIEGILIAVSLLAKRRSDFEMVIVGPANNKLREKATSPVLAPVVSFTGEISYPEVALQMQQASALVLFSRYENFPCVIIEALCCGLPVISSDTGGIKEAVSEENGFLVQSENEEQLLEAMNRMMNEYHIYNRSKIATEASQLYSYHAIGKKFYELYREVIENKAG